MTQKITTRQLRQIIKEEIKRAVLLRETEEVKAEVEAAIADWVEANRAALERHFSANPDAAAAVVAAAGDPAAEKKLGTELIKKLESGVTEGTGPIAAFKDYHADRGKAVGAAGTGILGVNAFLLAAIFERLPKSLTGQLMSALQSSMGVEGAHYAGLGGLYLGGILLGYLADVALHAGAKDPETGEVRYSAK